MAQAAAFLPGGGRIDDDGLAVVGGDGIGAVKEDAGAAGKVAELRRLKGKLLGDEARVRAVHEILIEGIPAVGLAGCFVEDARPGRGDRTSKSHGMKNLVDGGALEIIRVFRYRIAQGPGGGEVPLDLTIGLTAVFVHAGLGFVLRDGG